MSERYAQILALNRARQQRYYERHQAKIVKQRRDDRAELKQLREQNQPHFDEYGGNEDFGDGGNEDFGDGGNEDFGQPAPPAREPEPPVVRGRGRKAPAKVFTEAVVLAEIDAMKFDVRRGNVELSEGTKKVRKSGIQTVFRVTKSVNLLKTLSNFGKVKKAIDEATYKNNPNKPLMLNSRKVAVETIVWVIDHLNIPVPAPIRQSYLDLMDVYKIGSTKEDKENRTYDVIPYTEYLAKIKDMYGADSKHFVIASLYSEATLRDNFYNLVLVNDERSMTNDKDNYLVAPRAAKGGIMLVINTYKTDKKYGVIKVKLSVSLSKLLRDYISKKGVVEGSRLFPENKTGLSAFISTMTKKIAPGAKGGIDYIRQSKISEQLSKAGRTITDMEKVELARKMGHSPMAQIGYVRKLKE